MATADVGALIERARVAAGLSQRALADVTGISQSTLSRIISGDRVAKLPEDDRQVPRCRGIPHDFPIVRKIAHAAERSHPSDQPSSLSSRGMVARRRSMSDVTASISRSS